MKLTSSLNLFCFRKKHISAPCQAQDFASNSSKGIATRIDENEEIVHRFFLHNNEKYNHQIEGKHDNSMPHCFGP